MSEHTLEWLNTMVLIGCTDKRGKSWHHRANFQTPWDYTAPDGNLIIGIGNHYPQGIPIADVRGRLFGWLPVTEPVYARYSTEDGTPAYREIPNARRVFPADDPLHTFYIATDSYVPHPYDSALLGGVSQILDTSGGDLVISSAGLLKDRAIAWVEVSVPDTIRTPEGIQFRPNLLATTSLNGSTATTYKRTCTNTVCDNTLAISLREQGQEIRVAHTKNSTLRLADAREALAIVHTTADAIQEEFAELCRTEVTNRQFAAIVAEMTAPPKDKPESKAGATIRERKTGELFQLWNNDNRVTQWKNTAHGVLQAFNTHAHHFRNVRRSTNRVERNMLATIRGDFEQEDRRVYATMMSVLDNS